MVGELRIEQQRLGRDAAHVQAGAAELVVFLDERGLQAKLAGADGGGVTGRAGANDGNVIDRLWQRSAPYWDECGVLDKQMIVDDGAIQRHGLVDPPRRCQRIEPQLKTDRICSRMFHSFYEMAAPAPTLSGVM